MKNILIIAYYYPPKGGSGVQRISKFAKYLSRFGYNVNVLTVKEENTGLVDKSLKEDIASEIKVYRTDIKEGQILQKLLNKFNRKNNQEHNIELVDSTKIEKSSFYNRIMTSFKGLVRNIGKKVFFYFYYLFNIPDDKKGWLKYAVIEGEKIIREQNIDTIISTSAPYTCHFIANELSKKYSLKWVADFRDPWVSNAFVKHGFVLKKIYTHLEKKIISNADKVISVSKPIIDDFILRYPEISSDKFKVITNGYDEDDFNGIDTSEIIESDKFTILYNGTLYGIESPESMLYALEDLIECGKVDKDKIVFKFVGNIGYNQKILLDKYNNKYKGIIEYKEYLPHKESLKEFQNAHALLLILNEVKGVECVYTGKIFEYMRSGKPIIGIVPKGVARDVILETSTGYVADPSKKEECGEIIYKLYKDFQEKKVEIHPRWERVKSYSRENLTKELINILKALEL